MKKEYATQKIKPVLFAAVFILIVVLLLSACPNAAGTNPSTQGLIIEGTVLKGYRGEKPTGVLEIPDGITEIAKDALAVHGFDSSKVSCKPYCNKRNCLYRLYGIDRIELACKAYNRRKLCFLRL